MIDDPVQDRENEIVRLEAEVERLTKERDEALSASEEYRFDAQRWRDACTRNSERLEELKKEDPQRLPSPVDAVVDEVLFGDDMRENASAVPEHVSPSYKSNGDSIPAAHAEKVLVDVAKQAARLGAEEMRNRVVKMLKTSAQAYGSASTACRDYARDAALNYVSRIEGWTL